MWVVFVRTKEVYLKNKSVLDFNELIDEWFDFEAKDNLKDNVQDNLKDNTQTKEIFSETIFGLRGV